MKRFWTDDELIEIWSRYPNEKTEVIARDLGRTVSQVYNCAFKLGLAKSPEYLASPAAARTNGKQGMGTRFQKGQQAWNKGMKGLDLGGSVTWFKPGHRGGKAAELYQPIGTERISKDGYLERKINDDMPLQKRWRAVHLIVWEAANGPLPKGYAVVFKDGDKRNTALENLEMISRADLMRRNTRHRLPKELNEVIQLRAVLTRQINKRSKQHEQENDQ